MIDSNDHGHASGRLMSRFEVFFRLDGAGTRNRTQDLLITNQLLYQLSYAGTAMGRIISLYQRQCWFFCWGWCFFRFVL